MTQQPLTAKMHRNFLLRIGVDTYEKHASNVQWGKSTTQKSWKGGTPDAIVTGSAVTDHNCAIMLAYDYDNEDSLFNFMIDHEGEEAEIEWMPDADGRFTQTSTITIVAPDSGGAIDEFGNGTVTCPSTKPVRTFATPAAPTITSANPNTGAAAGGNLVVLIGTGYTSATQVEVAGIPVDEDLWEIVSNTIILLTMPPHAAGATTIVVENPEGASAGKAYTYV